MSIKTNDAYVIDGHDLNELSKCLTAINAMSGQQLAGRGDDLRDLVQKAQLHVDAAEHAPELTLQT